MKQDFLDALTGSFVRGLSSIFGKLPRAVALTIGRVCGYAVFYVSKRRHAAYADLKSALGGEIPERERWKIIRGVYGNLGQTAVEFLLFPTLNREKIEKHVKTIPRERYEQSWRETRPVIYLTAHFGNWELMQIYSELYSNEKSIHVLARDQKEPRLNRLLNQFRELHGSTSVSRGMGLRDLLRAIRRNDFIGMLGDQDAGKTEGLILPLFGRKTTVPTGAFELARRTGAIVYPCFIVRQKDGSHEMFFEEPIDCSGYSEKEEDLAPQISTYLALLEKRVRRNPDQWLWTAKRWKYTWTKRIVVLSDGKPGHVKQAEALAEKFLTMTHQYERPGLEFQTQTINVKFRSEWCRRLFPWFALCFIPWVQGRMRWLRFFFDEETQKEIEQVSTDFVISAGASLVGLNLCLGRESDAKSIVLMKPSFPFNLFRFDLAVVGVHDQGIIPKEAVRTLLTLSPADGADLEAAGQQLKMKLREPLSVGFSVFLGGATKDYHMDLAGIEKFIKVLERVSKQNGKTYLFTTSRRTPETICRFLKNKIREGSACQRLVIANEDPDPKVVPGFMALADVLIVTEDSISMISEAVRAGKKVIVLSFGGTGLPPKHQRFREILEQESVIVVATPDDLQEKIFWIQNQDAPDLEKIEDRALAARLEKIL